MPEHKQLGFNITLSYQHRPYVVFTQSANPTQSNLIDDQLTTELDAAIGLFGKYQIGVGVPFTLYLAGDEVGPMGMPTYYRLTESGIGDIRVEGKALLATLGEDEDYTLGLSAGLTFPPATAAGERTSATRP